MGKRSRKQKRFEIPDHVWQHPKGAPIQNDSDHTLVERVKASNDQRAFASLVKRYWKRTYIFLLRATRNNHHVTTELCNTVFMKAYKGIRKMKRTSRFSSWLFLVARNVGRDYYRSQKTGKPELLPLEGKLLDQLSTGETPEMIYSRKQWAIQMRKLVNTLRPLDREAIQYFYFEQLSYAEIAEEMEISLSHVKAILHRGRKRLLSLYRRRLNE